MDFRDNEFLQHARLCMNLIQENLKPNTDQKNPRSKDRNQDPFLSTGMFKNFTKPFEKPLPETLITATAERPIGVPRAYIESATCFFYPPKD